MDILDLVGFTHGATEMTIALSYLVVLIVSSIVCGLITQWEEHVMIATGAHVKSNSSVRHLYLASEEPACAPVPKSALKLDPYNALYDEEFSYPEKCPPLKPFEETVEHAAMEGTLKKAA
jgi:hypothetical protein